MGLIFKLLLKSTIPLVLLVGSLSYGLYMSGGDPAALLKQVGGGMVASVADSTRGVAADAQRLASDGAGAVLGDGASADSTNGARHQAFYTWKDADGVTHYSSNPDDQPDAQRISVDSQRNLVAAVKAPPPPPPAARSVVSEGGSAERIANEADTGLGSRQAIQRALGIGGSGRASTQGSTRPSAGRSDPTDSQGIPGIAGMAIPEGPERDALIQLLK